MCWMTIVSVRTGNTVHVRLLLLSELSAVSSKCTSKNINHHHCIIINRIRRITKNLGKNIKIYNQNIKIYNHHPP